MVILLLESSCVRPKTGDVIAAKCPSYKNKLEALFTCYKTTGKKLLPNKETALKPNRVPVKYNSRNLCTMGPDDRTRTDNSGKILVP